MEQILINKDRLISSIYKLAKIGKLPNGGCRRLAFSRDDILAKKNVIKWCKEIGLRLRIDAIGNIFAKLENNNNFTKKSIGIGSHLDTQPHGGKFDGSYGVLAGLEVIRTIKENKIYLEKPVELIIWSNEEGSRYTPPLMGSLFYTDIIKLKNIKKLQDSEGILLGDELKFFNKLGLKKISKKNLECFVEIHIEQGPILENLKKSIGIVTSAQGSRGLSIEFKGEDAHSGTTPMHIRKDSVVALSNFVVEFTSEAKKLHKDLRATVGSIITVPGSRNTVSGKSLITVDIRHPNPVILNNFEKTIKLICKKIKSDFKVNTKIEKKYILPTVNFDSKIVSIIKNSCKELRYSHKKIVSGAGHDAVSLSKIIPSGMIFIPCHKGISHSEREHVSNKDLVAGCNVLLNTVLKINKK